MRAGSITATPKGGSISVGMDMTASGGHVVLTNAVTAVSFSDFSVKFHGRVSEAACCACARFMLSPSARVTDMPCLHAGVVALQPRGEAVQGDYQENGAVRRAEAAAASRQHEVSRQACCDAWPRA